LRKPKVIEESELDPWTLFVNAMRAPMTRDRYHTRVAKFFDFIGMPGKTLEQKVRTFADRGKNDTNWALNNILKFVYFQRERIDKKEISAATVRNYTKSINYFVLPLFTMNDASDMIGKSIFPKVRMAFALTISIMADLLDYIAAPALGMPIIGDMFDFIVISFLYSITKSKVSFVINLAEFIPYLGDFLPVYTVSTIIWILRESGYDGPITAKQLLRFVSSIHARI
jgi:hypothetical protein